MAPDTSWLEPDPEEDPVQEFEQWWHELSPDRRAALLDIGRSFELVNQEIAGIQADASRDGSSFGDYVRGQLPWPDAELVDALRLIVLLARRNPALKFQWMVDRLLRARSLRRTKPTTKPRGVSVAAARRFAERYYRAGMDREFPGLNVLAARAGCNPHTMSRALLNDQWDELAVWYKGYLSERGGRGRPRALTGKAIDSTPQSRESDPSDVLHRLIEKASAEERKRVRKARR